MPARTPITGPHGPIFPEFRWDAPGAVAQLKKMQGGEAPAGSVPSEVGDIDFVWGKEGIAAKGYEDGFGLSKILRKHPDVAACK